MGLHDAGDRHSGHRGGDRRGADDTTHGPAVDDHRSTHGLADDVAHSAGYRPAVDITRAPQRRAAIDAAAADGSAYRSADERADRSAYRTARDGDQHRSAHGSAHGRPAHRTASREPEHGSAHRVAEPDDPGLDSRFGISQQLARGPELTAGDRTSPRTLTRRGSSARLPSDRAMCY